MTDLTRWNRAGLGQVNYVQGNAATYLEELREALGREFATESAQPDWLRELPAHESAAQWGQRLLEQYRDERRDYSWEMLRSLARAVHVTTGHVDAYANERTLPTASQWDNLRRLVNMLDYQPAPPASAEAWLALLAAADIPSSAQLEPGLAVKNQPVDGSAPLVFETLDKLELDYRLNQLRAPEYDRSQLCLAVPAENQQLVFPLQTSVTGISVGAMGVLSAGALGVAVEIRSVAADSIELKVREQDFTGAEGEHAWPLADTRLQLCPGWNQAPRLNGSDVVAVDRNPALKVGDVVATQVAVSGAWTSHRVRQLQGQRIELSPDIATAVTFYRTLEAGAQLFDGAMNYVLPRSRGSSTVWNGALTSQSTLPSEADADGVVIADKVSAATTSALHYVPTDPVQIFLVTDTAPPALEFDGESGALSSDGWLLLQSTAGQWRAAQIASIDTQGESFILGLATVEEVSGTAWRQAWSDFGENLRPREHLQNFNPVYQNCGPNQCELGLTLLQPIPALVPGRKLWVVSSSDASLVSLNAVPGPADSWGTTTLSVSPSLAGLDFPAWDTQVYGNVALVGHGEIGDETVLGSGDRIQASQRFYHPSDKISYLRDSSFGAGVRASVEVSVGPRTWTQVDSLRNSAATDRHYSLRTTEDGQLEIGFGDGRHGQRLPTGDNNVRIQVRQGTGAVGNLPPRNLSKLGKPHRWVESVLQPAASTGGGDSEGIESLRENAPASVLTLNRAVTVADYQALTQRHSSVWRARAFGRPNQPGATDLVEVVVVPVGGGDLGQLQADLEQYLQEHSRPGVQIMVSRYQAVLLELNITARINHRAFDPGQVSQWLRDQLADSFALQNMRLGESLFRSRVYQVIESVTGIENATCTLNALGFVDEEGNAVAAPHVVSGADGEIRRINPAPEQCIYLNPELRPVVLYIEDVDG